MTQEDPPSDSPNTDSSEEPSMSIAAWLEEASRALTPTECEDLTELGIYSAHEGSSARTITLPKDADAFTDAHNVKQYYFDSGECPLLIVTPVQA